MLTALDLKKALCDTYHFAHSLGHIHDMFLCIEKGRALEQVIKNPTIYLCVSKSVNKDEIIVGISNYFDETSKPILLIGANGELFECPTCARKMTDFSFPAHLKHEHRFLLIAVNYSACAEKLEKQISRNAKKAAIRPAEQINILEDHLESSTIKSLYKSALVGEKRKIRAATYRKFVDFENEIKDSKNLGQDISPTVLSKARSIQEAIRNAIKAKRIIVEKNKRRKKRKKNRLQIFSGGLPGLGKKN